ncbi:MAG: metalloregulator ArsR/SmtB family transcription factor [Polyangiaceae bacterium]|nr:metalloregulator ArsR/SmtB family transcription factor [Polyangiaceae bacterium]
MPLAETTAALGALADTSRLRLLALLAHEELTVAELVRVTGLGQSRVSTHLARLKDVGLVQDRRSGAASFYSLGAEATGGARATWEAVAGRLDDPLLAVDRERAGEVVRARSGSGWPELVAGRMDRHYSPGRTWEATLRGLLGLVRLGEVLDVGSGDGVLAALLAPRATRVTCLDRSERVIAAARRRLSGVRNVRFVVGDMHALPFERERFDTVTLFNVLAYSESPPHAVAEAARVLREGGTLSVVALAPHQHADVTATYGHVNTGIDARALRGLLSRAGLSVEPRGVTCREARPPGFAVVTAVGTRRGTRARERPVPAGRPSPRARARPARPRSPDR